jgi:hypothetical protein
MLEAAAAASEAARIPAQLMLPAIAYQPVAQDEVAAAVDADARVRALRETIALRIETAYRHPDKAGHRLQALVQEVGGEAVAERLQQRPALLGPLRIPGWFSSSKEDRLTAFALATVMAQGIGPQLVELRDAEDRAGEGYRRDTESRRQREAHAVPALSAQARTAIDRLAETGAAPGRFGPAPWDDRGPDAEEIRDAARLAAAWTVIAADRHLHAELEHFMRAARCRLPRADAPLSAVELEVEKLFAVIESADRLAERHVSFQAYVAAEPQRRAAEQAAQDARQREAEQVAREKAVRQAESERRRQELTQRNWDEPRPRASPGPGMG